MQPQLKELKKHIGEVVLLTGGGSNLVHDLQRGPDFWLGILEATHIKEFKDHTVGLQVKLTHLTPRMTEATDEFEPIINSWQISVLE